MVVCRDHGLRGHEQDPSRGLLGCDVCMHAGPGPVRISQTTCSLIVEIPSDPSQPLVHWITGSSSPCLSLFKPVLLPWDLTGARPSASFAWSLGPVPGVEFDGGRSLWWRNEIAHRLALCNFAAWNSTPLRTRRAAIELEEGFRARVTAVVQTWDPSASGLETARRLTDDALCAEHELLVRQLSEFVDAWSPANRIGIMWSFWSIKAGLLAMPRLQEIAVWAAATLSGGVAAQLSSDCVLPWGFTAVLACILTWAWQHHASAQLAASARAAFLKSALCVTPVSR
jgi:hypothetical protein